MGTEERKLLKSKRRNDIMRLIDADHVIEKLVKYGWLKMTLEDSAEMVAVQSAIDDEQTVDAQPVVHARWLYEYKSGFKPYNGVVCNHCDCWNERRTDYCPNCGAKMNRKED